MFLQYTEEGRFWSTFPKEVKKETHQCQNGEASGPNLPSPSWCGRPNLIFHARLQKVTVVRANRANWILLFLELRLYSGTCQRDPIIFLLAPMWMPATRSSSTKLPLIIVIVCLCHTVLLHLEVLAPTHFLLFLAGLGRCGKPAKRSVDLGPFARRVRQRRALQWEAEGWMGRDETSREETRTTERT